MPKEVIRRDLVKQYVHIPLKPRNTASNFMSQNLPLVAMFLKNKPLAWACFFLAFQTYLNDPLIKDPSDDSQPPLFRVLFSIVAIGAAYLDLFFPNMSPAAQKAAAAAKTATEAILNATATATATATAATS